MSAYKIGFNDCIDGLYHNTYPPQSVKWQAYVMGFADAKRAKWAERIMH